jgi:DNA-binding beta-propeller fold protein YncE
MTKIRLSLITCIAFAMVAQASLAGTSGLKVVDEIKIGGDGGWDYVTADAGSHQLYVAHKTSIAAVDLNTKAVNAHFADANGAHIALAVNAGADVLITNGKSDQITINDAKTGAVKATIATDGKPDAAIVEPMTGHAFVMANGGNAVDVIDLTTNKMIGKIPVGGAAEAAAIDGVGLVYTHLEDKNAFVVIDAKTMTVTATHIMSDCSEPSGIAFIPAGRFILSACKNGVARISSADTGAEVATVAIGARPDAALYDPARKLAYIPTADGKMSVIGFDGTPHIVDVIATKVGARTAVLDPATGKIYLPWAEFGPIDPTSGRPVILPGTFKILVVGQ